MNLNNLKHIKKITTQGDPSLERFFITKYSQQQEKYNLPALEMILDIGDPDKLWIQCHDISVKVEFKSGDVFIYEYKRGFVYDKASVPVGKDNILEAVFPTKGHDVGCSCHYLAFLGVNGDKGFRANNLLFYYSILWFLEQNKNAELKQPGAKRFAIRVKFWFKRRRAKIWYRAVNSIAGQGFYEKNLRAWHKKTSSFKHVKG